MGAVTLMLAVGMTGCEPNLFRGPLAARVDGESILLTTCRDVVINRIVGQVQYSGGSIVKFLEAEGSLSLNAGDQLDLSEPPAEFVATSWLPIEDGATEILVTLMSDDNTDVVGEFDLPLPDDGSWQGPAGTASVEPCNRRRPSVLSAPALELLRA